MLDAVGEDVRFRGDPPLDAALETRVGLEAFILAIGERERGCALGLGPECLDGLLDVDGHASLHFEFRRSHSMRQPAPLQTVSVERRSKTMLLLVQLYNGELRAPDRFCSQALSSSAHLACAVSVRDLEGRELPAADDLPELTADEIRGEEEIARRPTGGLGGLRGDDGDDIERLRLRLRQIDGRAVLAHDERDGDAGDLEVADQPVRLNRAGDRARRLEGHDRRAVGAADHHRMRGQVDDLFHVLFLL